MMQSTFILSLIATAVSAQQYGGNGPAKTVSKSASCSKSTTSTITLDVSSIPATALPSMTYSTGFSTSIPVEITIDQPAPSLSVHIPLSLVFNPENALAFTSSTEIPNPTIGPLSSTTPYSGADVTPAPSLTYSTFFSTSIPVELTKSFGISIGIDQPAPSASTAFPASESFDLDDPAFTSSTEVPNIDIGPTTSSIAYSGMPTTGKPKTTLCTSTRASSSKSKPTITVWPKPTSEVPNGPKPHLLVPDEPSVPSDGESYGEQGHGYSAPGGKPAEATVSSKPCTLETRVKPTATPTAGDY